MVYKHESPLGNNPWVDSLMVNKKVFSSILGTFGDHCRCEIMVTWGNRVAVRTSRECQSETRTKK